MSVYRTIGPLVYFSVVHVIFILVNTTVLERAFYHSLISITMFSAESRLCLGHTSNYVRCG